MYPSVCLYFYLITSLAPSLPLSNCCTAQLARWSLTKNVFCPDMFGHLIQLSYTAGIVSSFLNII